MIYLITGLPGNGKTLYALQWVKAKAEKESRPVFYAGITGLTLPWTEIDATKWFECPANAIVVIDECQRFFGVRGRGAPIPPHAQQLETHRHLGIDLVFITQSPMLLDSHDRSLIGTHFHVVRNFGLQRSTVYEFQQCEDQALKRRSHGIRHEWAFPKDVFAYYKSAEVHTHKARIPARVWILCAAPVLVIALIYFTASRWQARIRGEDPVVGGVVSGASAAASGGAGRSGAARAGPLTRAEYLEAQVPRIEGLHYTAPVYDEVTRVAHAPYPAACVRSAKECRCYTQQATRLDVPEVLCRQVVERGFFVAWDDPPRRRDDDRASSPAPAASAGPVGDSGWVKTGARR